MTCTKYCIWFSCRYPASAVCEPRATAFLICDGVISFAGSLVISNLNGAFLSAKNRNWSNSVDVFKFRSNILIHNVPQPVCSAAASHLQLHKLIGELLNVHPVNRNRKIIGVGCLVYFPGNFRKVYLKLTF